MQARVWMHSHCLRKATVLKTPTENYYVHSGGGSHSLSSVTTL